MMFYGYHRVSTKEQNLERGIKGIEDFCKSRNYKLEKVFVDKMSGRTIDRPRYTVLKEDVLREGDTLIIYELDRLARDKKAISNELRYYDEHNIRVMILDIPTTTTDLPDTDAMNKLIVVFAYDEEEDYQLFRKMCNDSKHRVLPLLYDDNAEYSIRDVDMLNGIR